LNLPGSSPLRPGVVFGRYEIVRPLGAGGMGAVFEAVHVELGKRVAIKALLPQLAARDDVRARMIREGRAAAQIRHPHVVDIFDVGTHDGITYLVMELLEGEDLGQRLKRMGPLAPEATVEVLLPVLAGLSAAHARGVLHRDLKPANIFLTRGPHGEGFSPKLLDFGIAKTLSVDADQPLTTTGAIIGTPHYMSPEQVGASRDVTPSSDQYAMGVIAYHALTGRPPFSSSSIYAVMNDVVHGRFPPLREARPELPDDLVFAIDTAMRKDPDRRFASVLHFGAALLPFGSERTRAQWAPVFGGPLTAATEPALGAAPPHAGAQPAPGDRDAGTRPPAEAAFAAAPDSVVDTHLPLRDAGVRGGTGRLALAAALALALVAVAGYLWTRGPGTDASPAADEAHAAPPAEASAPAGEPPAADTPSEPTVAADPDSAPPAEPPTAPPPRRRAAPTADRAPSVEPPKRRPRPAPRARDPEPRRAPAPEPAVELGTNDAPILQ
jgi:serine/threonine-protein kinase